MIEELQQIGFTEKESHVYLALLRKGSSLANTIAKELSIHRTVVYNVLQQLVEKGHVTYVTKEKKRHFQAAEPQSLLTPIKEKEARAEKLIREVQRIQAKQSAPHHVEVYEGLDGLRIVHEELRKAKDLCILNATGLIFQTLKYSAGHIVKDITKGKARIIAVPSMRKTPMPEYKKLTIKYFPKEVENYATTFIFDDTVIIQVLKEKPFITKIVHKDIAEGYRQDFDYLWSTLT